MAVNGGLSLPLFVGEGGILRSVRSKMTDDYARRRVQASNRPKGGSWRVVGGALWQVVRIRRKFFVVENYSCRDVEDAIPYELKSN